MSLLSCVIELMSFANEERDRDSEEELSVTEPIPLRPLTEIPALGPRQLPSEMQTYCSSDCVEGEVEIYCRPNRRDLRTYSKDHSCI